MARYTGPLCRICIRAGEKLFLKGIRCLTDKCGVERRKYAPGQHGQSRGKLSDYGVHLLEKQKVRKMFGVNERQFRSYFEKAARMKGITGEVLLQLLERRLDRAVCRMGFALNIRQGRQLVAHGHFLVNGRRASIPSFLLRPGDVVEVRESSRNVPILPENLAIAEQRGFPSWSPVPGRERRLPDTVQVASLAIDGREVDPREVLVFLPDGLGVPFRVAMEVRGLEKAVEGDAAGRVRIAPR